MLGAGKRGREKMNDNPIKPGLRVNLVMKPVVMKDWVIKKETKKCYLVQKRFDKRYGIDGYLGEPHYIPKDQIACIRVVGLGQKNEYSEVKKV